MGLDPAKLEELRRWGEALREAGSEESAAAGRAILMLTEELERLRLELWRLREQLEPGEPVSGSEVEVGMGDPVASALHGRLERALGRDLDQSGQGVESDGEPGSARSWIETLRRQR
jgi:hypothetical protein